MASSELPPPPATLAQPLSQRLSNFVQDNRKAVIAVTAGAVVAGGLTYYYYNSSSGKPPAASGEARKKSKKSAKKSKAPKTKSPASPTTASDSESKADLDAAEKGSSSVSVEVETDPLALSKTEIEALSRERREQLAVELKTKGNKAYSAKQYQKAVRFYSKAIECEEQAVFYSNRAACYTNLKETDLVIQDCTDALRLDPTYVKALNRRGGAREGKGGEEELFGALCDFTAAAILDAFKTTATTQAVDRLMKRLSEEQAASILKSREPRLPSVMFIRAYMEAFRTKPLPTVDDNSSQGDRTLVLGLQANQAGDYPHAMTLVGESIEQGLSSNQLKAQAHNMRGTFRFIMGNPAGALEDLDLATDLDRSFIQSWVKKASVHMELGQTEEAFQDFTTAIEVDPADPDIYYHRGQVYFILGNFADAIAQYQKSTELDGHFIYSQIQHGVALYKEGRKEKAELKFKKLMKTFPNAPEVFNYYGELQLDQASTDASFYDKAVANFDRATALEDAKEGYRNVLPMINKALCLFQKDKSLIEEAEEICRQALAKDPLCDVGVATLAQLYVQQNKIDPAVEMFEKSVELARTEPELTHILQYLNATRAQQKFVAAYPKEAQNLGVLPPASV